MRGTSSLPGTTGFSPACRQVALALLAALACGAANAHAQTLPELTVTALSITGERTSAPEGQAFHVTIHVHARQRAADLSSLVLPDVTDLTILGDEKHTAPVAGDGTDYREVLTVAGIAPGEATISPAYIDARDPSRGGRAFRFSSNALRIRITSTSASPAASWRHTAAVLGRAAAGTALGVAALVALGFVLVRVRRRRTYVTLPQPRPVAPRPAPARIDHGENVRNAAARLAAERTRERAAALRAALFAYAGARSDDTLGALLTRIPEDRSALRAALRTAERATFVDEANLQGAIEDALEAARRMSRS